VILVLFFTISNYHIISNLVYKIYIYANIKKHPIILYKMEFLFLLFLVILGVLKY